MFFVLFFQAMRQKQQEKQGQKQKVHAGTEKETEKKETGPDGKKACLQENAAHNQETVQEKPTGMEQEKIGEHAKEDTEIQGDTTCTLSQLHKKSVSKGVPRKKLWRHVVPLSSRSF